MSWYLCTLHSIWSTNYMGNNNGMTKLKREGRVYYQKVWHFPEFYAGVVELQQVHRDDMLHFTLSSFKFLSKILIL